MAWRQAVLVLLLAMVPLCLAPHAVGSAMAALDWILGAAPVLFVYTDSRRRGAPPAAVFFWTALTFVAAFYAHGAFVVLILYVPVTRGGR